MVEINFDEDLNSNRLSILDRRFELPRADHFAGFLILTTSTAIHDSYIHYVAFPRHNYRERDYTLHLVFPYLPGELGRLLLDASRRSHTVQSFGVETIDRLFYSIHRDCRRI
jgi:hypothetical protein